MGSIETQADIMAMLPSKQSSLQRSRSTIERGRSIKRRDNKSIRSIHPPSAASQATMTTDNSESIELNFVNINTMSNEEGGQDFVDEDENWRRLQDVKSMTSSLDVKRKAR